MPENTDALTERLKELGLSEQKAKETLKNATLTGNLTAILHEVRGVQLSDNAGMLLYQLASKIKPQIKEHMPTLVKYILLKKLDSTLRVDKAVEFLLSHIGDVTWADFDRYCGVGVVVRPEDIERIVENLLQQNRDELLEKRYRFNVGQIMQRVRSELPWADGKAVKSEVELQIFDLLGPKTEQDLAPPLKTTTKQQKEQPIAKKKKEDNSHTAEKQQPQPKTALTILDVLKKLNFHAPGENFKTEGYVVTEHTRRLIEDHLKATGGQVRTRFPPEPNGILHIGHAKAININFGYAAVHGGVCFLRYDDTNPEKEEEKYFRAIKDMVEWLGYKPYKITHSSDYFDQLYEWAVRLIEQNLAYVCHQSADEMKGFNPVPSPWRDRPVAESLQLFEDMKNGKIDEGAATLRMKLTLEEGKLDPVAYRVRFVPHHRTGDKWCIYPTYDYTHCLCDSLENITHSLCTKEFQSRRSSYYWLCNALEIYCPVQWEYGRLNVNYTVVSKRKIAKLITEGIVADWDDPRLFTLTALRRRGFPAEAINNFCAQLGVTGSQSTVDPAMLEAYVRDQLNASAPRAMAVLDPLKITIENYPHKGPITIDVPDFPGQPERGQHGIIFNRVIYIDKSDFMEKSSAGFRRLAPNQAVGLRHAGFVLSVEKVCKDSQGQVVELRCTCMPVDQVDVKPKAFVHWVADPIEVEVRLYDPLFKHKNPEDPEEVPGGFLSDCNKDSLRILPTYADRSLSGAKVYDKFQFERVGFFSVDPDTTTHNRLVLNLTVSLKEDSGKSTSS